MSRSTLQGFSLLLLASLGSLLVVGCGWHLRGAGGSGLEGVMIYLLPEMGEGELSSATSDALTGYGAKVVSDRKTADWILVLLDQNTSSRTISVTPQGDARAYELSYTLRFRVDSGAGAELLSAQSVGSQLVYQADPFDILANESQARRLTEQLRQQALELMVARLANMPHPNTPQP